jgi:hypothetical protein
MENEQQATYHRQRVAASAFRLAWLTLQAASRRYAFGRLPTAEEVIYRLTTHLAKAPGDPLVGAEPWVADRNAERARPALGGLSVQAAKRRPGKQLGQSRKVPS